MIGFSLVYSAHENGSIRHFRTTAEVMSSCNKQTKLIHAGKAKEKTLENQLQKAYFAILKISMAKVSTTLFFSFLFPKKLNIKQRTELSCPLC